MRQRLLQDYHKALAYREQAERLLTSIKCALASSCEHEINAPHCDRINVIGNWTYRHYDECQLCGAQRTTGFGVEVNV